MDINKEDIKKDPVYRDIYIEEVIRYKARFDEDERVNKEKAEAKNKKLRKELTTKLIITVILAPFIWINIIKPFLLVFF